MDSPIDDIPPPPPMIESDYEDFNPLSTHDEDDLGSPPPPPPPAELEYSDDEYDDSDLVTPMSYNTGFFTPPPPPPPQIIESPSPSMVNSASNTSTPSHRSDIRMRNSISLGDSRKSLPCSFTDDPNQHTLIESLFNNFDVASAQVEDGIYTVKRVIALARKLVAMEDEYYRSLMKALQHESNKVEKMGSDNMVMFQKIYQQSKSYFEQLAAQHHKTSESVYINILQPLMDFHASAEARLKSVLSDYKKCSHELAQCRSNVSKNEKDCSKLYHQLEIALQLEAKAQQNEKEANEKGSGSFFSKMKQKLSQAAAGDSKKLTDHLVVASRAYQDVVIKSNARLQQYIDQDLVRIYENLSHIDKDRLILVHAKLDLLHNIYGKTNEKYVDISAQMIECSRGYDVDKELQHYYKECLSKYGKPIPYPTFVYKLPATPEDLAEGKLHSNPLSVFKTSLAKCMDLQPSEGQHLDVPYILDFLIEAIKERDGLSTEGIFRVSHQKDELKVIRSHFENGEYILNVSSPHAPAALLKEWLRDLSDSLIPADYYQEAITAVKGNNLAETNAAITAIFNKIAVLNQNVIRRIALLCGEIASPENAKLNRMTIDNLAIVFAPSFLRYNGENEMEMLNNAKYESKFTAALLTLAPSIEQEN